jgi:hypothetical protein
VVIRITHKERIMEAGPVNPSQIAVSSAHPLLLVAAASVSLFSLAGVGVLAGWLPGPGMKNAAPAQLLSVPAAAPTSIQKHVNVPQGKARTVAKSDEPSPGVRRDVPAPVAAVPATDISHQTTSGAASPAPTYGVAFPEPPTGSRRRRRRYARSAVWSRLSVK